MMTMNTILRPVHLLAGAEATDHAIGMFIGMLLRGVMAAVAGVDFGAAGEAEPAVGFGVVIAAAATGEFLAADDSEIFFWTLFWEGAVFAGGRGGGDA